MADKQRDRKASEQPADEEPARDRAGVMMREAAQAAHSRILDDPDLPDQPSGIRHLLYFTVILVGAFALNLVVLVIVAR